MDQEAGRDCEDAASAGGVIVVAAYEPTAVVAGLGEVAAMRQAIE